MLLDGKREESHVQTRLWLFRAARAAEDVPSCACKPFFGEMLIRLAHTCTALFYVLPPSRSLPPSRTDRIGSHDRRCDVGCLGATNLCYQSSMESARDLAMRSSSSN